MSETLVEEFIREHSAHDDYLDRVVVRADPEEVRELVSSAIRLALRGRESESVDKSLTLVQ